MKFHLYKMTAQGVLAQCILVYSFVCLTTVWMLFEVSGVLGMIVYAPAMFFVGTFSAAIPPVEQLLNNYGYPKAVAAATYGSLLTVNSYLWAYAICRIQPGNRRPALGVGLVLYAATAVIGFGGWGSILLVVVTVTWIYSGATKKSHANQCDEQEEDVANAPAPTTGDEMNVQK